MILFHGGSWCGGKLTRFRVACAYFASRGLVCATAEYQMLGAADAKKLPAGETKKRVCVTDAKSAIRWFKQHAGELGIDPQRIIGLVLVQPCGTHALGHAVDDFPCIPRFCAEVRGQQRLAADFAIHGTPSSCLPTGCAFLGAFMDYSGPVVFQER